MTRYRNFWNKRIAPRQMLSRTKQSRNGPLVYYIITIILVLAAKTTRRRLIFHETFRTGAEISHVRAGCRR